LLPVTSTDVRAGERRDPATVLIASPAGDLRGQLRERLNAAYATHDVSQWESLDRTISTINPAVVLLDLGLLRASGITDLSILRRISRKARIILLSGSPTDEEGVAGLKAGARGYCARDMDEGQLRKAVDRVQAGEIWAQRRLIPLLVDQCFRDPEVRPELRVRSRRRLALLTPREREIAFLIGSGATNRDIAARLKVGEGTVKAHLTAIFRKLGFTDRLKLGLFLANPNGRSKIRH
jgi:DNA-binding NarL/FixJ family response regulator